MRAGHAWRKNDTLTKSVIKADLMGKRPLGRPNLRWEDCVKRDVKVVNPARVDWREVAEDRER